MGICDPCAEDRHEAHRGAYHVDIKRKGTKVKSRTATCVCSCTYPPNWRGEPQPVPRIPR